MLLFLKKLKTPFFEHLETLNHVRKVDNITKEMLYAILMNACMQHYVKFVYFAFAIHLALRTYAST